MRKYAVCIKHAATTVSMFFAFYVILAIRAYGIIKDFDYLGGFLMVMGAALFFGALEALARIDYSKRMPKAVDERKPPQYIAKVKTVYHSLVIVWLILILFTFAAIVRTLGWNDVPGNKTVLIVSVCVLIIAVPVIGICNYFIVRRQ